MADNPNDLDELGKEMEEALKSIGQDIPTATADASATPGPSEAPTDTNINDLMGAGGGAGGGGGGSAAVAGAPNEKDLKTRNDLQFILDIPFEVTIEVGRAIMVVKEVVNLGQGSVIELDRLTGENLDVLINGRVIGQGEVVVVNDKFGVRLKKVITPQERIEQLR